MYCLSVKAKNPSHIGCLIYKRKKKEIVSDEDHKPEESDDVVVPRLEK